MWLHCSGEEGSDGSRTQWCLSKCCDLQGNAAQNGRWQTNKGDTRRSVLCTPTQGVSAVVGTSLHSKGTEAWRNEFSDYAYWMLSPMEERYVGSTEAGGRRPGWTQLQLCILQSGVVAPTFGRAATHLSPNPSCPGCQGLFPYFPALKQVTSCHSLTGSHKKTAGTKTRPRGQSWASQDAVTPLLCSGFWYHSLLRQCLSTATLFPSLPPVPSLLCSRKSANYGLLSGLPRLKGVEDVRWI